MLSVNASRQDKLDADKLSDKRNIFPVLPYPWEASTLALL